MNREGEEVSFNTYEKPETRVINGVVLKSISPENSGFEFWLYEIEAEEKFVTKDGKATNICYRSENEINSLCLD